MNKTLLITALAVIGFSSANAQSCILEADSVTAGRDSSQLSLYYYNGSNDIIKKEWYDSLTGSLAYYDTLIYTGGNLTNVHGYWIGSGTPDRETLLTYDTGNRVIRVANSGDNGGPWAMAHDITYNGAGQVEAITYDLSAIVGSPEGFPASFTNLTYSGGNLTGAWIVGDLGAGFDTLELAATSDTKNNLQRLMYISEGPDLLEISNTNNMVQVTFINNEVLGPAGTIAIDRVFTYTLMDEVATMEELPGVFESEGQTEGFRYSCTTGLTEINSVDVSLFPNPTSASTLISCDESILQIQLYDVNGRLVQQSNPNQLSVTFDVSSFDAGMYLINVRTENGVSTSRLIIE